MACRAYLDFYDAGPAGAPLTKDDLLGSHGDPAADVPEAVEPLGRSVDDTILDEPGHQGNVPHGPLTAGMRGHMAERRPDGTTPVGALRAELAAADRGEHGPDGRVLGHDAFVRTGSRRAAPV